MQDPRRDSRPNRGSALPWALYVTAATMALGVTLAGHYVSQLDYERRLYRHEEVLANRSYQPYQYCMYGIAQLCEWLTQHAGLTPIRAFMIVWAVGYLALFLCMTYLLWRVYRSPGPVLVGLCATAAYSLMLLPCAYDHPSDVFGVALLTVSWYGLQVQRPALMIAAAAAGGFFWQKQLLTSPVVLMHYGRTGRWARGLGLALLYGAAAAAGWVYFRVMLGPHAVVPQGILTTEGWLAAVPRTLVYHLGFAGPPAIAYLVLRRRLTPLVHTTVLVYPLLLLAYAVQRYYPAEMRSFWAAVPAFVLVLAAWADDGSGARDARSQGESAPAGTSASGVGHGSGDSAG